MPVGGLGKGTTIEIRRAQELERLDRIALLHPYEAITSLADAPATSKLGQLQTAARDIREEVAARRKEVDEAKEKLDADRAFLATATIGSDAVKMATAHIRIDRFGPMIQEDEAKIAHLEAEADQKEAEAQAGWRTVNGALTMLSTLIRSGDIPGGPSYEIRAPHCWKALAEWLDPEEAS